MSSNLIVPSVGVDPGILSNEDYFDPLNQPERWTPRMRKPWEFDAPKVARYQKFIDRITGLSRGHSIIKLEWGPDVLGWQPYPHGSDPIGYTQPTWLALWDKDGNDVAAPRWMLSERCEPEQYLPGWEDGRWVWMDTPNRAPLYDAFGDEITEKGKLHDVKGEPPPDGLYTPWHCHAVHHSGCCSRPGNEGHCWGYYVEPNQQLLEFIAERAWIARNDKEVDPTRPVALLKENRSGNDRATAKLEGAKLSSDNTLALNPRLKESPNIWVPQD